MKNIRNDVIFYDPNLQRDNIITREDVLNDAREKQKIPLIKKYRIITGGSLRDSKDAVDNMIAKLSADQIADKFCDIAGAYSVKKGVYLSKEQFLNIIDNAIESSKDMYFVDMLDVVEALCANIRKKGGLDAIAAEYEEFINNI